MWQDCIHLKTPDAACPAKRCWGCRAGGIAVRRRGRGVLPGTAASGSFHRTARRDAALGHRRCRFWISAGPLISRWCTRTVLGAAQRRDLQLRRAPRRARTQGTRLPDDVGHRSDPGGVCRMGRRVLRALPRHVGSGAVRCRARRRDPEPGSSGHQAAVHVDQRRDPVCGVGDQAVPPCAVVKARRMWTSRAEMRTGYGTRTGRFQDASSSGGHVVS